MHERDQAPADSRRVHDEPQGSDGETPV
jgi:hypothetical protein